MVLKTLELQNFRNHSKATFSFDTTTIIVGKNTAGKTNILEAVAYLSMGKSFKAEKEIDTISLGKTHASIHGIVTENSDKTDLKINFAIQNGRLFKKFLVNNVSKRQLDYVSHFYSVLFTPTDIDIISGSPALRRRYVDSVLCQAGRQYRAALAVYEKSLRHRNRMLYDAREGRKNYRTIDFEYWDAILIENGAVITSARQALVDFFREQKKEIFPFDIYYNKSTINSERLEKYRDAERAAAVTLVGPQRDDFIFLFPNSERAISEFGSRGEQRLTLLQMKVSEIQFLQHATGEVPTLLLDDIFSELDEANIHKVFDLIDTQQTIITTTHEEFVPRNLTNKPNIKIIEL